MADDGRVNFARQGTGLMPADKAMRARSEGQSAGAAIPSGGSQHQQEPSGQARGDDNAGYTVSRYNAETLRRIYRKPRKRGKRGSGRKTGQK